MFVLKQFLNFHKYESCHKPVSLVYSEGSGYKADPQAEYLPHNLAIF